MTVRQQVLYLWGSGSSLDSAVVAWAFHDGTAGLGPGLRDGDPPYETGTEALQDGWFLLQGAQLIAPPPASSTRIRTSSTNSFSSAGSRSDATFVLSEEESR